MACYAPLPATRRRGTGEKPTIFARRRRPPIAKGWEALDLPCGQCIGCRNEKRRQWAMRIMAEKQLHDYAWFVTFTYNDEKLPTDGSLDKSHFQRFMKRLRRARPGKTIRYFHAGEYGDQFKRPHYHAALFGAEFKDLKKFSGRSENPLYISAELEALWGYGYAVLGEIEFESAAYVASYVVKKQTGPASSEKYLRDNALTGEVYEVEPEYATMSRRPGLAGEWLAKYSADVYPSDEFIARGHPTRPPRYFDKLLERWQPATLEAVKLRRQQRALETAGDNTPARLAAKEAVATAKLNLRR